MKLYEFFRSKRSAKLRRKILLNDWRRGETIELDIIIKNVDILNGLFDKEDLIADDWEIVKE